MKKISFFIKSAFHIYNILLGVLYLYPGSIIGLIFYQNIEKQPQLTSDFIIFSSNHIYAFLILSLLGLFSYHKNKTKTLFLYLFLISIFFELFHILIPNRSFQYQDLLGNLFGVLTTFLLFKFYQFIKDYFSD